MSRSFKKIPIIKDSGDKSLYRRIYRRKVKQIVKYYCKTFIDNSTECFGCECMEEDTIWYDPNWMFNCPVDRTEYGLTLPIRREVIDSIDIYDWHKYKPGDPKTFRK